MTDASRSAGEDNDGAAYPGAPRWVKAFGIVAILVVLLVILRLTAFGGHGHGPGRHIRTPADTSGEAASGAPTPAASVDDSLASSSAAGGHTPPDGGH